MSCFISREIGEEWSYFHGIKVVFIIIPVDQKLLLVNYAFIRGVEDSHIKRGGMLVGNFKLNPQKETNLQSVAKVVGTLVSEGA